MKLLRVFAGHEFFDNHPPYLCITSASRAVLPVVRIDGTTAGDGRAGRIARDLMCRLAERVQFENESVRD